MRTICKLLMDKRFWLVAAIIVIVLGIHLLGIGDFIALETLRAHRQALAEFVQHNLLVAMAMYVAIYIAATAFSLPGAAILTVAGGFLFGAVRGTLLAVTGATVGATLVFLFARILFGEQALGRLGPQARKLADAIRRNAASYLLVLRLVPLFPFFLVNLVPAFVGVRRTTYVLTTFFGIIPGTAVYSLSGAGLGAIFDSGEPFSLDAVLTPEIIAALLGLAMLALLAIPIRNRFGRNGSGH